MIKSESIGQLSAALTKAQATFGPVIRDKEVEVKTKAGYTYKFKYAPYENIVDAIRKPLADNELSYTQLVGDNSITTILMHSSGEYIGTETKLVIVEGTMQGFGSSITYIRRYALGAIVGLAIADDDDGNIGDGNKTKKQLGLSAKGVLREEFDKLDQETQEWMRNEVASVLVMIRRNDIAGAVNHIDSLNMDNDAKTAMWSLFETSQSVLMDGFRKLRDSKNMDELKEIFTKMPKYAKDALEAFKDKRKTELGG